MLEIKLKEIRKRNTNLSQNEAANILGVNPRTYGSWERGEAMLSLKQAYECAQLFHCTIDEIAGRKPVSKEMYDKRQKAMNEAYESLDESGKAMAAGAVRALAADARVAKNATQYTIDPLRQDQVG